MMELLVVMIITLVMTFIGVILEDSINSFFHRRSNRKRPRNESDNFEDLMRQQAKFKKVCIGIIGICIAFIIFVLVVSRIY